MTWLLVNEDGRALQQRVLLFFCLGAATVRIILELFARRLVIDDDAI